MFFPVRLAHSGWLMCTSPPILPQQLYGILLVPPRVSLWKPGPATAEYSDCSCFTLLLLGEKKLLHNPPKGLKARELQSVGSVVCWVSQAKFKPWSLQNLVKNYSKYPFHDVWSTHILKIYNIWGGGGMACMTLIYMREVKGHFEATFFSLKIFSEGKKKQTSQAQHISMSRVFVCLSA